MIRLIAATLVEVGRGHMRVSDFTELVRSQDRTAVKYSAPAKGLCLLYIAYPPETTDPFPAWDLQGLPLGLRSV